MIGKAKGKVTMPRRVFKNLAILPWAAEVNRCLQELRDRVFSVPISRGGGGAGKRLPFEVVIFNTAAADEEPAWKVRVYPGRVNERVPGEGTDQTKTYEPDNLYQEAPNEGLLSEFAVVDGDGVYISVRIGEDGTVTDESESVKAVNIEIETADPGPDSVHYQPKVDNETPDGVAGTYKYKLAEVEANDGGALVLKKFLAGSHISHFQELPAIRSTLGVGDGIGVIPKRWDNVNKCYKLRPVVKGLGDLGITTNSDEIEVRGNKQGQELVVYEGDTELSEKLEWRDGLIQNGQTIEGDEDPPATITDPFEIYVPVVQQRQAPLVAQVTVTQVGAIGKIYQVEGNGKDGYLSVNGDATALEWVDGLVTAEGAVDIETSNIPDGAQGDMLYWDGTAGAWVLLLNPGAPTSPNRNFLIHDGTVPSWIEMEAQTIYVCIAGTPTAKTIYIDP